MSDILDRRPNQDACLRRWAAVVVILVGCGTPPAGGPVADVVGDLVADGADPDQADQTDSADAAFADTTSKVDAGCRLDSDCPSDGPCQLARCRADGSCLLVELCECKSDADCAPYDDGDLCNGTLYCDQKSAPFTCRLLLPSVVQCPVLGDSWCMASNCEPTTGACAQQPIHQGQACDDGDPCHLGRTCADGVCSGGVNACACTSDADCADLGGDACEPDWYCDKSTPLGACEINPASVTTCSTSGDTTCNKNVCDPANGACAMSAVATGTDCDDGDPCTPGDACEGGLCQPGTADLCACQNSKDCGAQEDGDVCNGTLYCDKSVDPPLCKLNPATVVLCPSVGDTACAKNACEPVSGVCKTTPIEGATCVKTTADACRWITLPAAATLAAPSPCDDDDACTTGEVCSGGTCGGGKDLCACGSDADCAKEEDGNACNGTLYCDKTSGACLLDASTVVTCAAVGDTACLKNACAPSTGGCMSTAAGLSKEICSGDKDGQTCRYEVVPPGQSELLDLPCDDGDVCTAGDVCKAGKCAAGTVVCLCNSHADCAAKEDGNLCNGTLFCDGITKSCKLNPATVVKCPTVADTACSQSVCQPLSGLCKPVAAKAGTTCDDGDPCTAPDTCADGKCGAGAAACACASNADCKVKEDGDPCNGTLYCDKSGPTPKCKVNPVSVVVCKGKSNSPCLVHACQPKTGTCAMVAGHDGWPCDDGSACTAADACKAGKCLGVVASCDDGNACTADACDVAAGCQHVAKVCNDNNPCTVDTCDKATGECLANAKALNGKQCDADGNPCTVADSCQWGTCTKGPPPVCKGGAKTCHQSVCKPVDKTNWTCVTSPQPNGTPCDDGKSCTVHSTCNKGSCNGGIQERYYVRYYKPPRTHGRFHAVAPDGEDLVAVGVTYSSSKSKNYGYRWWVVGLDAAGNVRWQRQEVGVKDSGNLRATAAADLGGGQTLVAGGISNAAGESNIRLVRYDDEGKLQWAQEYGHSGSHEMVYDMLMGKGGSALLVGIRTIKNVNHAHAVQVGANGQKVWEVSYGAPKRSNNANSATRLADGSLVLVGSNYNYDNKVRGALVLPVSASGKVGKGAVFGAGSTYHFTGVTQGAQGKLLAGGFDGTSKNFSAPLHGFSLPAKTAWKAPAQSWGRIERLIGTAKGRVAAVGYVKGKRYRAWVRVSDRYGNPLWNRTFGGSNHWQGFGLADLGNQGLAAVGWAAIGSKYRGLVVRMDHWGRTSCSSSGKCDGKPAGSCDDGKPCTSDWCDPSGACKHSNDNNRLCITNDGCSAKGQCSSGSCKPSAQGRLFASAHTYSGGTTTHAETVALTGGGYVATGQTYYNKRHSAWVTRYDAQGTPVWKTAFAMNNYTTWGASVLAMKDGGFVMLARNHPKWRYGTVLRRSGSNKLLWNKNFDTKYYERPLGLVRYLDGNFGVIVQRMNSKANNIRVRKYNTSAKTIWTGSTMGLGQTGQGSPWLPLVTKDAPGTGSTLYGFRGDARANGTAVIGGTLYNPDKSKKRFGWLAGLKSSGSAVWYKAYWNNLAYDHYILDVAAAPNGWSFAGGVRAGSKQEGWLLCLDAFGNVKCNNVWNPGKYGHGIDAVRALSTSEFLAGGWRMVSGKQRAWLGRFTVYGSLQWHRTLGSWNGYIHAIDELPGGDLLLGGSSSPNKTNLLFRSDRWGHLGCLAAGPCLSKSAKGCTDKNKCTADYCLSPKGCYHTKLPKNHCSSIYY